MPAPDDRRRHRPGPANRGDPAGHRAARVHADGDLHRRRPHRGVLGAVRRGVRRRRLLALAVGTLAAGRFANAPSLWLAEAAGLALAAAGAALLAVGGVPAIIAGGALFGLGEGLVLVFHLTLRAKVTPDGYFGRITGVAGVLGQITSGLSILWLGLVLRFAPGRPAFIVLAAAALALAVAVALAPKPSLPPP